MNADMAMYEAKSQGKRRCVLYTPSLRTAYTERSRLIADLEEAVATHGLVPFYQPKVDARSFTHRGAEALVRWPHPTRGMVGPQKFLTLAEERGLVGQIDRLVFKQVCADVARWQATGAGIQSVSINLSAARLLDTDLIDD